MTLLIPYHAIAPAAHRFSTHEDAHADAFAEGREGVREAVGNVSMQVRAEVSAVDMPVEDVLALRAGDVLRLGSTAGGITLLAGDVPVHRARPGRSGSRRAVQVLGPVAEGLA
jgi:flagellar motor switch protein FliM